MAKKTVGESLIERLVHWGVDTVFGLPGDGVNGLMEGLRRQRDTIRFILVEHEEAAAFMAVGYAKATGRIGVALATSGPGGIHLRNGLYDAKLDHVPVLAITGSQESGVLGTAYQQEVSLDRLYMDVAQGHNLMITNPAQVPAAVDTAIRTALAGRVVSHLTVPNDIQVAEVGEDPYPTVAPATAARTSTVFYPAPGNPRDVDVAAAAAVLDAGERVAILVGAGAAHARKEILELADVLAAPIVKSLPGKHCVPDDSEFTTGGLGLLGTAPSEDVMAGCDTLLMLGTNDPYTKYLPSERPVRTVQVERDAGRVGTRIPTEVPMVADVLEAVRALLPRVRRKEDRSFLEAAQRGMTEWRARMAALETADRKPIAPQYLMHVVDAAATQDAILTCDSGTVATWAARHWTIRGERRFYLSGNLASMAPALPYAIAIQHAFRNRQVVAFVGDGGFAMLMAEFLTAVRYRLPVKVVVNNNNGLGMILWEQIMLGNPEFGVRYREPVADFAAWARACGGFGVKVSDPADLDAAVHSALAHDGPALVDCDVDPDEPPMPARVQYEQAKGFAQAFLRGQPRAVSKLAAVARDRIEQLGRSE